MASILKVDSIGKTSGSTQDTMAGMAKVTANVTLSGSSNSDAALNVSSV